MNVDLTVSPECSKGVCPLYSAPLLREVPSQTLTVLSQDAVARRAPAGENATERNWLVSPGNGMSAPPGAVEQGVSVGGEAR